jgi:SAM-dependent methyltransferase
VSRDDAGGTPWWEAAFGAHYETLYAHRDDASAAVEVAGLLPRLRTAPGLVLDACCGNGRHLAALRAAGLPAFGFDLSADLLASARRRAGCRDRLVRCDMRAPALGEGWGAVLMLFTAFGYFDDEGNAACLAAIARLLAPGGFLVLDLPDLDEVRATLVPRSERDTECGHLIEERRLVGNRVEKTVTITAPGTPSCVYRESVRLYDQHEIAALAARCGLVVDARWDSLRCEKSDDHRHVYWLKTT